MTRGRNGGAGVLAAALLLGAAAPAAGQVTNGAAPAASPTPVPVPTAEPTALPTPAAPVIVLPSPAPRPAASRTPAPRPSPSATAQPRPTPEPTASATPRPAASGSPVDTLVPVAPAPPPSSPSPSPSPSPPPLPAANDGTGHYLLVAFVTGVLALGALGWVLMRRRPAEAVERVDGEARVEEAPPAAAPQHPRARLALAIRPRRAGINLLSATSENDVVVTNIGDAPATEVRLQLRLLSAHAGTDADLAAFYAEPVGRPAVPAFTLAPGEARTVSGVAALPRDAIRSLTAADRPMFVPVVAVNIVYDSGAGAGQLAQAFAVGIERVDSAKLAPFWLDAPPRTYDQVAARPHAAAVER